MLKQIPIIIQLSDDDVRKSDLLRDLKIDMSDLDRQLSRQPVHYARWAMLYSTISAKVAKLKEELDVLDSGLYTSYRTGGKKEKVTDVKRKVAANRDRKVIKARLRKWQNAERFAKYAVTAFEQRLSCLQSLNANVRREKQNI